ncbi:DUF2069 domain-containing protein [Paraferrimonas haliotis]|uniref:DUF2069 domain-containing protein n=1 Tax=Paraferrimonas haliotis TaxID=2013866 RepID=A0AA37WYX3_9GAMM|nr:DUF2069 domain-containing protein [Paraferrimonas haliotis]GLS84275.1 hypothetical protein GCM10007894_22520 [Paraferrimonas haliotis]
MSSLSLMRLCRIGYLAFCALVMGYFVSRSDYSWVFIALFIAPLLLPLKGIIEGKPYTYAWCGFILSLYLCHGLTLAVVSSDLRVFAIIESVMALILIAAMSYFARMRVRELGISLKQIKANQQA